MIPSSQELLHNWASKIIALLETWKSTLQCLDGPRDPPAVGLSKAREFLELGHLGSGSEKQLRLRHDEK